MVVVELMRDYWVEKEEVDQFSCVMNRWQDDSQKQCMLH